MGPGDAAPAGLVADFDDDGFADPAVGTPAEDVDGFENAGAVTVLPGSTGGPTGAGSQLFTRDSPGVPDGIDHDEFFGQPLAALPGR